MHMHRSGQNRILLKRAYITAKVEGYFWRTRDHILDIFFLFREAETTPAVELLHGSLAHPRLWNIVVTAANTMTTQFAAHL